MLRGLEVWVVPWRGAWGDRGGGVHFQRVRPASLLGRCWGHWRGGYLRTAQGGFYISWRSGLGKLKRPCLLLSVLVDMGWDVQDGFQGEGADSKGRLL